MRRVQTKQTFKLRLLAFVLAVALVWYSLNPAPRVVIRKKQAKEPPDEKRKNLETQAMPENSRFAFMQLGESADTLPLSVEDEDDFEWPEFIDG